MTLPNFNLLQNILGFKCLKSLKYLMSEEKMIFKILLYFMLADTARELKMNAVFLRKQISCCLISKHTLVLYKAVKTVIFRDV